MARIRRGDTVARALTEQLTRQTARLREGGVEPCPVIHASHVVQAAGWRSR